MDDFYTHVHQYPRRLGGLPQVHSLGYFRAKDHPTDTVSQHTSLSLVLAGDGRFAINGRDLPIRAPCAMWEPAGSAMHYAPTPRWEEFFVVWRAEDTRLLRAAGVLSTERPWWPLPARAVLLPWLERLAGLARQPAAPGTADRIDRAADQLVAEAVLAGDAPPDAFGLALREARARIDADPVHAPDPAGLAQRFGVHPGSLARRWLADVGEPMARYRRRQRLRLGCTLLAGGNLPISDVARRCGFPDPLHFSRAFARAHGCPPRTYRERHRLPLPG